jgi:hypothetical protein
VAGKGLRIDVVEPIGPAAVMFDDVIGDTAHGALLFGGSDDVKTAWRWVEARRGERSHPT